MKSGIKRYWLIILLIILYSCSGKSSRSGQENAGALSTKKELGEAKVNKVTFFIENSESMFGYVSNINEYVEVLSELAEKPEFVKDNITRDFYFVNGTAPVLTHIGNNPNVLKSKLNQTGFNCGDITRSNLNAMFQIALDSARNDNLSILISDGIYDVGDPGINSLVMFGRETRSKFIKCIQTVDIQTIMVKLHSKFNGKYFYASKKGVVPLTSVRPYYIWIFGDSKQLNKYFPDQYLTQKLTGFDELARFMKPGSSKVKYEATSENFTGTFKFDPTLKNKLTDAKSDKHGLGFCFSIAVDYSSLPYPETFLTSVSNYSLNNNYSLISIARPTRRIYSLSFTPTHLITVKTMKNPAGKLEVSLINNVPSWIASTGSDTEANIQADIARTFGFNYLTDGIIQAYEAVSEERNIASFKIDIQ
jgi:hypothetical protein